MRDMVPGHQEIIDVTNDETQHDSGLIELDPEREVTHKIDPALCSETLVKSEEPLTWCVRKAENTFEYFNQLA